ncbi:helix-turn-helix domain-containing protein [Paenibacillus cymbidii]|uniref:helix-turn-helix domain-containing protein n=1 Tax=Paenibacillus cymbidii TaxID=1639034 RepID=UPI00143692EE|nr:helix-turn-helix domain-containing protein [Paenibacillus cymbidii]
MSAAAADMRQTRGGDERMTRTNARRKLQLRFGTRSVMVPLFGSFIAILLIAVVSGGVLYWKARAVVERTVNSTNAAMLEQLREVADGRLKELEQLEQQVAFHPKLLWLLGAGGGTLSDEEAYRSVELVGDLQRYKSLSKLIYDFYIYVRTTGTLVGPNVKTTAPILFDSVYRFPGKSSAAWTDELQQGGNRDYEPATTILLDNGSGKRVIAYRQSIPYLGAASAMGTLLVLIDEDQLRNLFVKLAAASRGDIYIVDKRSRVISSTGASSALPPLGYEAMAGETGKQETERNGQRLIVSYATSEVNGWKYVFAVPRDVFLDEVNDVRRWAVTLLLLCALGGGAAAIYLAYRNYRPVRAVVRDIVQNGAAGSRASGSEYELIRSAIESSRASESHLRGMLAQQAPIIRVHFLTRLVRGSADAAELRPEALQRVGVEFVSSAFVVMLIEVGDISGFAPEEDEREWPFVSFIVANIATELANERHRGFSVELERGRVALLVNVREERSAHVAEDVAALAGTLAHTLENRFRLKPAIGASAAVHELGGIGEAYREALLALDQRLADSRRDAGPLAAAEEEAQPEPHFYYPLEVEQQLVNLIKSGDAERTEKLLDSIYEQNYVTRRIAPGLHRILLPSIAGTLLKLAQQFPELARALALRLASDAPADADAEAAFARLRESVKAACAHFQSGRSDQSERMLNNIRKHVRERYGDNMLSVNSIADRIGITPSYLSAFFKKASGQNIADFIALVRIAEAKRMLAEPQLTIAQIAARVGYANDIGFIRFFKKYEGVTPGAYRQSIEADRPE